MLGLGSRVMSIEYQMAFGNKEPYWLATTYLKPAKCPEYIQSVCSVCGILAFESGMGMHPNAEGMGIDAMLEHVGVPKKLLR